MAGVKRVKLIVTGRLEEIGLADALTRAFQGEAEFYSAHRQDSFTSDRLAVYPRGVQPPGPAGRIAAELVASIEPGAQRGGEPRPDLVYVIDDLELANRDQPSHVVDYFRAAIEEHLKLMADRWGSKTMEVVRTHLRTTCSFHLFVPMLEAYFFADPMALARLNATAPSQFDLATDMENFSVADPNLPAGDPRLQHPKRYANFMCDPSGKLARAYKETKQGIEILRVLDWRKVLSNPEHGRFLRALFDDLAWGLKVENPFQGTRAKETQIRDKGLLRNI